jgi:hypothetical protein
MKIKGEQTIAAKPEQVWKGLNDPSVLRLSIPGCKSFERTGDNAFKATIETKVGPVKAVFNGDIRLSNLDPPHCYTLSARGTAGSMGNAKGSARIRLVPSGTGTKLTYDVDADVSGKFTQIGSRLIQGTANTLADQFFTRFGDAVAPSAALPSAGAGIPWWILAAAVAGLAAAGYYFFR